MSDSEILSLYTSHRRELVNYANGIVADKGRAEDIAQDAYLRFHTAMVDEWRENPVAYLYRIVRNLALDSRRRSFFEKSLFSNDLDDIAEIVAVDTPCPEKQAITRNELERLQSALDDLPKRTRIALEMHRFGGYKLREIAQHLGISQSMAQHLVKEGIKHCQCRLFDPSDF